MSKYKITKFIPIPESRIRTPKYPFAQMDVGDSFFVPFEDTTKTALKQSCYYSARMQKKKFRVVIETVGFRVFRVE